MAKDTAGHNPDDQNHLPPDSETQSSEGGHDEESELSSQEKLTNLETEINKLLSSINDKESKLSGQLEQLKKMLGGINNLKNKTDSPGFEETLNLLNKFFGDLKENIQAVLDSGSEPESKSPSNNTDSSNKQEGSKENAKDGIAKTDFEISGIELDFRPPNEDDSEYYLFYHSLNKNIGYNFKVSINEESRKYQTILPGETEPVEFSSLAKLIHLIKKTVREIYNLEGVEHKLSALNFSAKELKQIIPENAYQDLYTDIATSASAEAQEKSLEKFAKIFADQDEPTNTALLSRLKKAGFSWEDFKEVWQTKLSDKVYSAVQENVRQDLTRLAEKKLSFLDKTKSVLKPAMTSAALNGLPIVIVASVMKIILSASGAQAAMGNNATNSLVGAVGGTMKRLFGYSKPLQEHLQSVGQEARAKQTEKYTDQVLAELFKGDSTNRDTEMGAWIAQALREIGQKESALPDSDTPQQSEALHLAVFRHEAAKQMAREAEGKPEDEQSERQARFKLLVTGLQVKQAADQISLETKPAWQKWAQTTLDTLSGKLWLPKKEKTTSESTEKKSFWNKSRLGDLASVGVGATIGYAFGAGTEVTRMALTTVTGAAAGFEMGRKKDVAKANERFITEVKIKLKDLELILNGDPTNPDNAVSIRDQVVTLLAMSKEPLVQQDKGLSIHLHETLAEAMSAVAQLLVTDLEATEKDLKNKLTAQEKRLTNERTKGWGKWIGGGIGIVSGLVAGLGINKIMDKIHSHHADPTQTEETNTETELEPEQELEVDQPVENPEFQPETSRSVAEAPVLVESHNFETPKVAPVVSPTTPINHPEVPDAVQQDPTSENAPDEPTAEVVVPEPAQGSGRSEILSIEAKKGSSTSGLLDKLKKTELADSVSSEQKTAWSELVASKTKFHNWKVEQLQNMGYTYENGVGFTGHPMSIHQGADLKVVWDADSHKFTADFGDKHVTDYQGTHVRDVHSVSPEVIEEVKPEVAAAKAVVTEFKTNPEFKTEVTHKLGEKLIGDSEQKQILDIKPDPKNPGQVLVNIGGETPANSVTGEVPHHINQWFSAVATALPGGRYNLAPVVADSIVSQPNLATQGAVEPGLRIKGSVAGSARNYSLDRMSPASPRGGGHTGGGNAEKPVVTESEPKVTQPKVIKTPESTIKKPTTGGAESGGTDQKVISKSEGQPEPVVRRPSQEKNIREHRRDFEDTPDDVKRGDALQDVESDYQELNWTKGEKASFNNYLRFASWQNDLLGAKGSGLEKIVADNGLANVKDPSVKEWLEKTKTDLLQRQNDTTKILEDGVNYKKDFIKIRSELRRSGMFGITQISENAQLSDTPANLNFYKDNILLPHLKKTFEPIQEGLDLKTVNGK